MDPRLLRSIANALIGSPVSRRLGISLAAVSHDHAVVRLPFDANNVTVGEAVHGGVIATLIDVAAVASAVSGADAVRLKGGATASIAVNFLRPAQRVGLRADAQVVRRGARTAVAEVAVFAEDADTAPVAKALVSVSLFVQQAHDKNDVLGEG